MPAVWSTYSVVTSSLIVVPQDHDWERQVEQVQQVVVPLFIDRPVVYSPKTHYSVLTSLMATESCLSFVSAHIIIFFHALYRKKKTTYTAECNCESYRIPAILSHSSILRNASNHSTNCMMLLWRQAPVSCDSFSLLLPCNTLVRLIFFCSPSTDWRHCYSSRVVSLVRWRIRSVVWQLVVYLIVSVRSKISETNFDLIWLVKSSSTVRSRTSTYCTNGRTER